ncbi:unnamed protein product [Danaus chrysippus]|nr:unnamed protein product [Danaus chrysippus]
MLSFCHWENDCCRWKLTSSPQQDNTTHRDRVHQRGAFRGTVFIREGLSEVVVIISVDMLSFCHWENDCCRWKLTSSPQQDNTTHRDRVHQRGAFRGTVFIREGLSEVVVIISVDMLSFCHWENDCCRWKLTSSPQQDNTTHRDRVHQRGAFRGTVFIREELSEVVVIISVDMLSFCHWENDCCRWKLTSSPQQQQDNTTHRDRVHQRGAFRGSRHYLSRHVCHSVTGRMIAVDGSSHHHLNNKIIQLTGTVFIREELSEVVVIISVDMLSFCHWENDCCRWKLTSSPQQQQDNTTHRDRVHQRGAFRGTVFIREELSEVVVIISVDMLSFCHWENDCCRWKLTSSPQQQQDNTTHRDRVHQRGAFRGTVFIREELSEVVVIISVDMLSFCHWENDCCRWKLTSSPQQQQDNTTHRDRVHQRGAFRGTVFIREGLSEVVVIISVDMLSFCHWENDCCRWKLTSSPQQQDNTTHRDRVHQRGTFRGTVFIREELSEVVVIISVDMLSFCHWENDCCRWKLTSSPQQDNITHRDRVHQRGTFRGTVFIREELSEVVVIISVDMLSFCHWENDCCRWKLTSSPQQDNITHRDRVHQRGTFRGTVFIREELSEVVVIISVDMLSFCHWENDCCRWKLTSSPQQQDNTTHRDRVHQRGTFRGTVFIREELSEVVVIISVDMLSFCHWENDCCRWKLTSSPQQQDNTTHRDRVHQRGTFRGTVFIREELSEVVVIISVDMLSFCHWENDCCRWKLTSSPQQQDNTTHRDRVHQRGTFRGSRHYLSRHVVSFCHWENDCCRWKLTSSPQQQDNTTHRDRVHQRGTFRGTVFIREELSEVVVIISVDMLSFCHWENDCCRWKLTSSPQQDNITHRDRVHQRGTFRGTVFIREELSEVVVIISVDMLSFCHWENDCCRWKLTSSPQQDNITHRDRVHQRGTFRGSRHYLSGHVVILSLGE